MKKLTFAQSLTDARLMSDALKVHIEELMTVGLEAKAAERIDTLVKIIGALDTAQEKLKSELKKTTSELNSKMGELGVLMSDCRKRVKLAIDKDGWKEFGISSTR